MSAGDDLGIALREATAAMGLSTLIAKANRERNDMPRSFTAERFFELAVEVRTRFPDAVLERNMESLTIRERGVYRGFIDFDTCEIRMVSERSARGTP